MSKDRGSIYNNATPGVPAVLETFHPIQSVRRKLSNLPDRVKGSLVTAKGEFEESLTRAAFSFRSTPLVSRLRVEFVHPTMVHLTESGDVLYSGQDNDPLLSRNRDDGFTQGKRVISVDSFSFIFDKKGNLVRTPSAKHHVQSASFRGPATRGNVNGEEAVRLFGSDIQLAIETFGSQFLETIKDPDLKVAVANAMLGAREVFANPSVNFGNPNNSRTLIADPLGRTKNFFDAIHQAFGINKGNSIGFRSTGREFGQ